MEEFYWKKGDYIGRIEYYVSPEGKVCGEITQNRHRDAHYHATVWSELDHHFILLGVYISEEKAKTAIEDYCDAKY